MSARKPRGRSSRRRPRSSLLHGAVCDPSRRADRHRDADRIRGAVLGRRRNRVVDPGHRVGRRVTWPPTAHPNSSASGCHRCSAHQRIRYLRSFCSSEPGAGSDVGAILTRAVYDEANDEWVLNGVKTWATNGGIATCTSSLRRSPPNSVAAARPRSSSRRIPRGFKQGQKFKKHGIRASHTAEVTLDDVRLPGA